MIAAASGPVYSATLKEMKDSLDFWGVARTYRMGFALMETRWDHLSPKLKKKIVRQAERTAAKLRDGTRGPNPKTWCLFQASRLMQKYVKLNPVDAAWWEQQGWLGRARPWKRKRGEKI